LEVKAEDILELQRCGVHPSCSGLVPQWSRGSRLSSAGGFQQWMFRKGQVRYRRFRAGTPACTGRGVKPEGIPVTASAWWFVSGPKMEVDEGTGVPFLVEICCGWLAVAARTLSRLG